MNDDPVIYLVQHGEAMSKAEDPTRPLTELGRQKVMQVAQWAKAAGLHVDVIHHSDKLRAQQTAGIFADVLGATNNLVQTSGLAPNDEIGPLVQALARPTRFEMFVGHLPLLDRLAGQLLTGDPERRIVRFQNAALVGLAHGVSGWSIALCVPPTG